MRYAIYHYKSGEIFLEIRVSDAEAASLQLQEDQEAISFELPDEESVSWLTHKVVNGELVRLPEPRSVMPGRSFDFATGEWVADPAVALQDAKRAIEQEEAVSLRALREAVLELAKNKPDFNHPSIAKLITSDAKIGKLRKVIAKASK